MDSRRGYQQADAGARNAELETLFAQSTTQRTGFATELQSEGRQLGRSQPESSGNVASAIHRGWVHLKSALTSQDRHGIPAERERGEDSAVKSYREALADARARGAL